MSKLIIGEFIIESVKSNIDVINELNIHRLELGNLYYDHFPEINPIVNASRTFHLLINANYTIHSQNLNCPK